MLILQIIAHILSDYFFQTDASAKEKNENDFKSQFLLKNAFNYFYLFVVIFVWCKLRETFVAGKIESISDTIIELKNAGKLIGILERILVLTFVIIGKLEIVGFLIAAKSILRYKDTNTIKTEYVLIGTMLSFGIAIMIGLLID